VNDVQTNHPYRRRLLLGLGLNAAAAVLLAAQFLLAPGSNDLLIGLAVGVLAGTGQLILVIGGIVWAVDRLVPVGSDVAGAVPPDATDAL
jgi:hypothetical protein